MRTIAVVVLVSLAAPAGAQDPKLAFEVASVKKNLSGEPGFGGTPATGGDRPTGFVATNVTLYTLISRAYGVEVLPFEPERDIVGGPDWLRTSRFDINATAGRQVTRTEVSAMLRTLLEERFKLVVGVEQRFRDAYALRLARTDRRLGPDIRKAGEDCYENRPKTAEQRAAAARNAVRPSNGALPSSSGDCLTMDNIAGVIGMTLRATVVDETGVTGRWDYAISHAGLQSGMAPGRNGPEERPSIFAAVQEQLGLKVERRPDPAPYNVLVIKSVEPPGDN